MPHFSSPLDNERGDRSCRDFSLTPAAR